MKRYYDNPDDQDYFVEMARDYIDVHDLRDDPENEGMSFSELVDNYYDDIVEWIDEIEAEGESYVDELLEDDPDYYEHW